MQLINLFTANYAIRVSYSEKTTERRLPLHSLSWKGDNIVNLSSQPEHF